MNKIDNLKNKHKKLSKKLDKLTKELEKYKEEESRKLIKPYICCCCKRNKIDPIYKEHIRFLEQAKGMWSDGAVFELQPNYGSIHDLCSFYIGICDSCITDLLNNKLIVNIDELKNKI